ncbi:hypothetical protein L211DRAFT_848854 [Terfezia boudieri ATCC MYA-4762]|uniref:Uncharacterized protein n=1 Tax=Terfezia boudieri ATCC MYA-4762 TaxID=1051890 RepID=A0A3N4LP07_9PEZI|nr:hypothetical protein L211DRAFT_848854 [Terfezia boudieri ATCC MYA-4762]
MDISDMLNPENHSEEVYSSSSQAHTRIQNTTTTPRSTLSPTTQLSSLPSTHTYDHGYDLCNRATQPYQSPLDSRLYEISSPATFYSQHRKPAVDSATGVPLRGYGTSSVPAQTNPSHMPMLIPRSLGTISQDRPTQNRCVMQGSQGLYTHAQSQGTGPLAALATLATSRDFQDMNGQGTRRWGSIDIDRHRWDHESAAWGRQALSEGYHEPQLRRGSQPFSSHGRVNDIGRTVSVGSQTSRPNTPERASAFVGEMPSPNRSSPSSMASPMSPSAERMPDSPSSDTVKADDDHKCSYTESCETGSPLRKVVSHFFGRNKLATRKIPKHLWVYFCRKHYQRSRYRNPRGFACLQIQLVQTQIGNLRRWGGVIDWTVKVRRREEMRSRTNTGANQGSESASHIDCDGEAVGESMAVRAVTRRRASGAGGTIPTHYLQYVGEHKTMDEVTALVEAIQQDMESNGGTFPDLELLPRVGADKASGEGDEGCDRGKGKRARLSRPRPSQVRKRKGANVGDRGAAPTSAAEYTSIALSQRPGAHHANNFSAISRSRTAPVATGPPMTYTGDSMNMRPKRKLEIRCGEIEAPTTLHSEKVPTIPVHRITENPEPPKRRRFSQEIRNNGSSNDGSAEVQDQQTLTPPASASSASRRASPSLAAECVISASCLTYTVLEDVDTALESAKVTSQATIPNKKAA